MKRKQLPLLLSLLCLVPFLPSALADDHEKEDAPEKLTVLIVDGQNNHNWKATTPVMDKLLQDSGRFDVDVSTTPQPPPRKPRPPKKDADEKTMKRYEADLAKWEKNMEAHKATDPEAAWEEWRPAFAEYDVVLSNYTGRDWPEAVRTDFEKYVREGGGLVIVHAADNAFPNWKEYNEMIGLGGWGGRNEKHGPFLRLRDGEWVKDDTPGSGGHHGSHWEYVLDVRTPDHPITKGLPPTFKMAKEELYDRLRGPANNVTVLYSAHATKETRGSGEHEPAVFTIDYHKGKVFHTVLGHSAGSMRGLAFHETLKRGTEWAATGEVTFPAVDAETLTADKAAIVE